jgi:CDP-paratose 2-epimerase
MRPLLITGGAGFIGSNLADRLATEGENVLIYDSLARPGVELNLDWLRKRHPSRIAVVIADVRNTADVRDAVCDAAGVFHLAAQVAVTTSLQDPREDFEVNLLGTLNVLEALRHSRVPCVFASTNKVYGDVGGLGLVLAGNAYAPRNPSFQHGVDEQQPLDLRTPYGCSKGAADQYVLDYSRHFGVPTVVLRMSCIYGPRQFGTEDQGWVAHFVLHALAGKPVTIFGDGRQVRDVLFVDDAVRTYIDALRNADRLAGRAFNLGGGPANAVSLLQLIRHIERLIGRPIERYFAPWRPEDQRYYVSDTRRLAEALNVPEPTPWRTGVAALLRWLADNRDVSPRSRRMRTAGAVAA